MGLSGRILQELSHIAASEYGYPKNMVIFNFLGAGLVCSKPFGFKKCFERITNGVYMYVFCVSFSVATEEHVFRRDFDQTNQSDKQTKTVNIFIFEL